MTQWTQSKGSGLLQQDTTQIDWLWVLKLLDDESLDDAVDDVVAVVLAVALAAVLMSAAVR